MYMKANRGQKLNMLRNARTAQPTRTRKNACTHPAAAASHNRKGCWITPAALIFSSAGIKMVSFKSKAGNGTNRDRSLRGRKFIHFFGRLQAVIIILPPLYATT
jgi:hypothetical protein